MAYFVDSVDLIDKNIYVHIFATYETVFIGGLGQVRFGYAGREKAP